MNAEQESQTKKKNTKNLIITLVIIFTIGIVGGIFLIQHMQSASYVIMDVEFPIKPDTFIYEEFTVNNDGILKIDVSCIHPDSNLLWYIMYGDAEDFKNRYDFEFYELTYKRNITGGNSISDVVEIEKGTYTFVYIQTVGYIGERETAAKIVFRPA